MNQAAPIEHLSWDSQHFERKVGHLTEPSPTTLELRAVLEAAREAEYALVYWLASAQCTPDSRLLQEFGGRRIVGQRVYTRPLPATEAKPSNATIISLRGQPADPRLLELGVLAGQRSRFRFDSKLQLCYFTSMYETWMAKSLSGELADDVLAACGEDGIAQAIVTLSVSGRRGRIGLMSTDPDCRGKGLARALLSAAHDTMAARGAAEAEVATQPENVGACALYDSLGYTPQSEGDYYHFHLQEGAAPHPQDGQE